MSQLIEFGGPALPEGTRTWFYDTTLELETQPGAPIEYAPMHAYPGDRFPAEQVKGAESYVARGMARFVAVDEAPPPQAVVDVAPPVEEAIAAG